MSKAQQRLSQVQTHLASSEADILRGREFILSKDPEDIVITCALRTPLTKAGRGKLKDTAAADLLVHALQSLIVRSRLDPQLVEDIAVGSVLAPGGLTSICPYSINKIGTMSTRLNTRSYHRPGSIPRES